MKKIYRVEIAKTPEIEEVLNRYAEEGFTVLTIQQLC